VATSSPTLPNPMTRTDSINADLLCLLISHLQPP
jgi:hypothetical protein